MFNLMIRKGLATNDIRQFSLKQAAQQRVSKGPSLRLEKSAMKNKRSDLLAYEKRLKQQRLRLKRRLLSLYEEKDHKKISQVIRKINWCANKLKKNLIKEKRHKVEFISVKHGLNRREEQTKSLDKCPAPIKGLLRDLEVFNSEILADPPCGPLICHPDIKLDECEREILNRGPKYMIRKPVTMTDFKREVEKAIAKQNYNMAFNDGSDLDVSLTPDEAKQIETLETECKMVFNPRENNLSLSRLKATDFKYNKRIKLPEISDPNLEAKHQIRREQMEKVFLKLVHQTEAQNINNKKHEHSAKKYQKREQNVKKYCRRESALEHQLPSLAPSTVGDYIGRTRRAPSNICGVDKYNERALSNTASTCTTPGANPPDSADQHSDSQHITISRLKQSINREIRDITMRANMDGTFTAGTYEQTKKLSKKQAPEPVLGKRNHETIKYEFSNLSQYEKKGLSSLVKRISDGEIIVATSDKSNRFVVLKTEQYVKSGLNHTVNDQQIEPDDLRKVQNVLNSHTGWLKNIFNIGASWRHEERFSKNLTENGEQACPMTCLIKDHKGWQYSESTPIPPSRPVVAGNCGINRCLSELLSLIIEPVTNEMKGDAIDSTGDMLGKITELNKKGLIKELIENGPYSVKESSKSTDEKESSKPTVLNESSKPTEWKESSKPTNLKE